MKILLLSVRSDFGGGPKHMHELIQNIPQNIDVYAAFPDYCDPYSKLWNNNKRIKDYIHIPKQKFSYKAFKDLKCFVEKNKIDIIHSQGNGAGIYSRMLKMTGSNIKVIHSFHGVTPKYPTKLKEFIIPKLNKFLSKYTDVFIGASKSEIQMARKRNYINNASEVKLIFNGVEKIENNPVKFKGFNILTIARFTYQKNMQLCFEIAKGMIKYTDIRFIWVGDGEDLQELKERALSEGVNNIDFIGFSSNYFYYMGGSDIYLTTSRFEGLPYTLLEALSQGLPIISTNVTGNNDCVINGKNGYLYNNKEEAINYIISLYNDSQLLKKMSKESIDFFDENFNEKKMIRKTIDVYRNALASI